MPSEIQRTLVNGLVKVSSRDDLELKLVWPDEPHDETASAWMFAQRGSKNIGRVASFITWDSGEGNDSTG